MITGYTWMKLKVFIPKKDKCLDCLEKVFVSDTETANIDALAESYITRPLVSIFFHQHFFSFNILKLEQTHTRHSHDEIPRHPRLGVRRLQCRLHRQPAPRDCAVGPPDQGRSVPKPQGPQLVSPTYNLPFNFTANLAKSMNTNH